MFRDLNRQIIPILYCGIMERYFANTINLMYKVVSVGATPGISPVNLIDLFKMVIEIFRTYPIFDFENNIESLWTNSVGNAKILKSI